MVDDQSVAEDTALSLLKSKISESELELCRARSKVYALCSHHSERFEGEDYDIDLASAMFKGTYNGTVSSVGPLQAVGTLVNGEFCWAWHDSSAPLTACGAVQAFVEAEPVLANIATLSVFACKQSSAEQLVQWIAVKMGWTGAFEVPVANALSYLIVDIRPGEKYKPDEDGDQWCSYCGRSSRMVRQLFQASSSCSICNVCVLQFVDLLADLERSKSLSTDDAAFMAPCLVCGDKTPRIFSNYGAICYECLRIPAFQAVE